MEDPMSTAPSPPPPLTLQQMEVLKAFKEHLTREKDRNVSPFSDDGVIRYHTPIQAYDVPDIHREVRDRIHEVIGGIHEGRPSQVIILAGPPGMGKSHLLNYFRLPGPAREMDYVLAGNANSWKVDEFEECLLD